MHSVSAFWISMRDPNARGLTRPEILFQARRWGDRLRSFVPVRRFHTQQCCRLGPETTYHIPQRGFAFQAKGFLMPGECLVFLALLPMGHGQEEGSDAVGWLQMNGFGERFDGPGPISLPVQPSSALQRVPNDGLVVSPFLAISIARASSRTGATDNLPATTPFGHEARRWRGIRPRATHKSSEIGGSTRLPLQDGPPRRGIHPGRRGPRRDLEGRDESRDAPR